MTPKELAGMMDVTLVKNANTEDEIKLMIDSAHKYDFACAFTLACYLKEAVDGLKGTGVHAGGAIGFPSGGEFTEIKVAETKKCIETGADELDMVINLGWMMSGKYDAVLDELKQVREAAQDKPLKCIIEISCLDEYNAKKACELVVKSGADYVKTGTGWFAPATIEQVRLIKSVVGDAVHIKAAGGIRTQEAIEAFKAEGVYRVGIGLSSALKILDRA